MAKVVFVSEASAFGGAATHLRELIRVLDRSECEPLVLLPRLDHVNPLRTQLQSAGTAVQDLPVMKSAFDMGSIVGLIRMLRREQPDIIHAHFVSPAMRPRRIVFAARLAGVPVILATDHCDAGRYVAGRGLRGVATRLVFSAGIRLHDCLVTVSHAQRLDFTRLLKVPPCKLVTIHNGVDTEKFSPARTGRAIRTELRIDSTIPLIGMAARFVPRERCEDFILAAAEIHAHVPSAYFLIAGDAVAPSAALERRRLEHLASDLGLSDRVVFAGFRPDMSDVMAALDVFVLPASSKVFGIVLLEAMASGKPVVATNAGGVPEIVKDGESGFLVPPGSPAALASRVRALISDRSLASEMGRRGRDIAETEFSLARMGHRTLTLYRALLSGTPCAAIQ